MSEKFTTFETINGFALKNLVFRAIYTARWRHTQSYRDCLDGDQVIMPVPLNLGKAFLSSLRHKLVAWPMDSRPEDQRTYMCDQVRVERTS